MNRRFFAHVLRIALLAMLLLQLAACNYQAPAPATARPTDSGVTPDAAFTEEPLPSATPAPSATPQARKILLLAPPGSDPGKAVELQEALAALAEQNGLTLETKDALAQADPALRLVVVLPPDPGVLNLAAANPQASFLAVGVPGIEAGQNISVVASGGARFDQQGFLAGYLAAVVTPDWRAGVISAAGQPAGKAARNAFGNGLTFYCGLCRPAYPPFVQYPVYVDLPEGFGDAELQAAVDTLTAQGVKTVYLAPGVDNADFLGKLAQAGFQIIGSGDPPAAVASAWVASIRADEAGAFQQVVQRLLDGENGISSGASLALNSRNEALFSAGRQRVVDEILNNLLNGYIDTGIDPSTGEPRS